MIPGIFLPCIIGHNTRNMIAITISWFFSIFPLVPPWNYEIKSCLNKLKFWEASRNQERSICWKFKLSISLGTKKSAKIPPLGPRWSNPFDDYPGFSSWDLGPKVTGQVLFLNTQYNKIALKWMLLILSSYIDAIIHVYYWKGTFCLFLFGSGC